MTSGILALIIFILILGQIAGVVLWNVYRRKRYSEAMNGDDLTIAEVSDNHRVTQQNAEAGWDGFKEFIVQHKVFEDLSKSVCSFYLIAADGAPLPAFKPGQYITFKLDINDPKSKTFNAVTRCYTLSDAPDPEYFRVSIKRALPPAVLPDAPAGLVSGYFHDHIKQGRRLLVKAPAGQFHLMQDADLPIVLIAGGIGITPMLSMLNHLLETGSKREILLFYGVRNATEHIMQQHLQMLAQNHPNFQLHVCYSAPTGDDVIGVDYQHHSRVNITLLRSTLKLMRYQFYICGPAAMMETMVPDLKAWGVDDKDIYFESFGPSSLRKVVKPKPEQPAAAVTINFSKSGKTIQWDGASGSLLEFAEAHDIEVESGCRSGSCGGCKTEISAGDVAYNQQPVADVSAGHCLLCITTPKNDLILNA